MNKHTPGPWKAMATPESSNQNFVVLGGIHAKRVCAVYSANDEADANLIAAAPELLAALEQLTKEFEKSDGRVAITQTLRGIIARARGES